VDFTNENATPAGTGVASEELSFGGDKTHPIQLRDYQQKAVDYSVAAIRAGRNTVLNAPTGCGKSLLAAAICDAIGGRVLVLAHRAELIIQNHRAFETLTGRSAGIFSAAVIKDQPADFDVVFATIGTAFNGLAELDDPSLVIVDEVHMVPADEAATGRYGDLLRHFGNVPRLGLTATPYRLGDGLVHGPGTFFQDGICYQISASQLVADGYLSPLIGVRVAREIDASGCRKRGGEFVARDLADAVEDDVAVGKAVAEAIKAASGRQKILVFAVSILHVQVIAASLICRGETVCVVHGGLSKAARASALAQFKAGRVRWCVNCEVLTTGFDEPAIDAIALMRPTASKALHTQMLGRGMRLANGKIDCLILDFAGNIERHGNIDALIAENRKTEERERADAEASKPRPLPNNTQLKSLSIDPMTGLPVGAVVDDILEISYSLIPAGAAKDRTNVLVTYRTRRHGPLRKWLCPEYATGAAWHAKKFAAGRGINHWSPSAGWLKRALEISPITPVQVALVRNGRNYLEVVREIFPEAKNDWFSEMRGALE
jgi:DNA repair protein RadD